MEIDLNRVQLERKIRGLTQEFVSKEVLKFKSATAYWCLETGRTAFKAWQIKKLADFYGLDVADFYVGGKTGTISGNIANLEDKQLLELFRIVWTYKQAFLNPKKHLRLMGQELQKRGLLQEAISIVEKNKKKQ